MPASPPTATPCAFCWTVRTASPWSTAAAACCIISGATPPARAACGGAPPLPSYRTAAPEWEILLDIDALARDEAADWVFQGAATLPPRA